MTHPIAQSPPQLFSQSLPQRSALHLARKGFHFITGFCFALANQNLPPLLWLFCAWILFFTTFLVEVMRIRNPNGRLNQQVLSYFRAFIRSHETHQFAGILYYTFGVAITSTLFPKTCATLGILGLAVLDPIAAFAGSCFQVFIPQARMRNGKSILGFLFSANITTFFLFNVINQAVSSSLLLKEQLAISVFIAVIGSLIESLIPSPQLIIGSPTLPLGIDDNAIIPIVCATVAQWYLRLLPNTLTLSPLIVWRTNISDYYF